MSDFPRSSVLPLMIHSYSLQYSPSAALRTTGTALGIASATWVANLSTFIPMEIPFDYPVNRVFWGNGSSAAGNSNMGIFNINGKRIFSVGSTAQSGTNNIQFATPGTPFTLAAGMYYFAFANDGTTNRVFGAGTSALNLQNVGVLQQASNLALADPATLVTPASAGYPVVGITRTQANFGI